MLLHTIEIKNYRSLERVKLDNLQRFNVLIGRNNAGKSSVFQALYDLNNIIHNRGISSDVVTDRDMRRSLEIDLTFKLPPQEREEIVDKFIAADFGAQRRMSILESPFLRMLRFTFKAAPGIWRSHLSRQKIGSREDTFSSFQKVTSQKPHLWTIHT